MNNNTDPKNEENVNTNNTVPEENNDAQILINLESLIKSHISQIDKLKEEGKTSQEMLNDFLENDKTYKDHSEKAKEANKVKSKTKIQLLKQPQAAALADKTKSAKSSLRELQNALSEYLREYSRISGANEIETENGEVREIIYFAKLVKKNTL